MGASSPVSRSLAETVCQTLQAYSDWTHVTALLYTAHPGGKVLQALADGWKRLLYEGLTLQHRLNFMTSQRDPSDPAALAVAKGTKKNQTRIEAKYRSPCLTASESSAWRLF